METIWKFAIPGHELDDVIEVEMPTGARPLSVGNQNETLCIWARVWPDVSGTAKQRFRVAGTGHPLQVEGFNLGKFLGTVQFQKGALVFHVFAEV